MDLITEKHKSNVQLLCRICGNRCKLRCDTKDPKLCSDYIDEIHNVYGIDVNCDNSGFYPSSFCKFCYRRIINHKHRVVNEGREPSDNDKAAVERGRELSSMWNISECDGHCWVCNQFEKQCKGGRPKKRKGNDIISTDVQQHVCDQNSTNATTPPRQPDKRFKEAQTSPFSLPNDPHHITIESCLKQPKNAPLDKIEEALHTSLVKRKLLTSPDQNILYCKTKGQPIVLQKVRKPRKNSSQASSPLKRKRVREMSKIRRFISGKNEESSEQQHIAELKKIPESKREYICSKAGIQRKMKIASKQGVAMRTYLGLSYNQHRKLKLFLSSVGVKFACEKAERKAQTQALGNRIDASMINMQVNDDQQTTEKSVPIAHVKELTPFIKSLLDQYDANDSLTWHNGAIPEDEVWIKIGGDHGGNSFKMSLQIANVHKPNSKHHTMVFCIFEAKDTYKNLESALSHYLEEIKNLSKCQWRDKKLTTFLFGDYEFLCKVYGLSGAASKHPCLWCYTTKQQMQGDNQSRLDVEGRTLKSIRKDFKCFCVEGKGNIAKAKLYKNVIHKPLLPIHINKVCPPYLHMMLGIVKRHHEMLENECRELDVSIGLKINPDQVSEESHFGKFVYENIEIQKLRSKEEHLSNKLKHIDDQTPLQNVANLKKKISKTQKEISDRVMNNKLQMRKGPVASNLDKELQKHKITPQSYHGRSLIGNHCAKYIKPHVYGDICRSVVQITSQKTNDSAIITRACCIRDKFEELNRRFSQVHELISHDKPIAENEIPNIRIKINEYMSFHRRIFPSLSITPKMHMIEDHVCEWIQQWGFGMGLHGEQGGEQIHATFNLLQKRIWGIKTKKDQFYIQLKEHLLQTLPEFRKLIPNNNKRKLCCKSVTL